MSARQSIVDAIVENIKAQFVENSLDYDTNLQGNVDNKMKFFDDINDYPYVTIVTGPETREYLPSNVVWGYLTVYARAFVRGDDTANEQLEEILADLEKFFDTNNDLGYTILSGQTLVEKKTLDMQIDSIETDEGILRPYAAGEIALRVQYEKSDLYN